MVKSQHAPYLVLALWICLGMAACGGPLPHKTAAATPSPSIISACPPAGTALDDRTTPPAFVRSFYNAINLHEYTRAYSYLLLPTVGPATPPPAATPSPLAPPPFAVWKAEYINIACDLLVNVGNTAVVTDTTPGYAGIGYGVLVPVLVTSVRQDGTIAQFTGSYAIKYDPAVGIAKGGAIVLGFSLLRPA